MKVDIYVYMYIMAKAVKISYREFCLLIWKDKEIFLEVKPDQRVFTKNEMNNKINLHGLRAEHARKAYSYYADRLEREPSYKYVCRKELALRYKTMHTAIG